MRELKNIAIVVLGNFLIAFGMAVFVLPNRIICGGVTGFSLALGHLFGLPLAGTVFVLNVSLFILGAVVMGKEFALRTVVSTIIFPVFLSLLQNRPEIAAMNENILLSCMYGGLLSGLGIGIVISQGASTGGMDIPPIILNRKKGYSVSAVLYVADTCSLALQAFFSETMQVLYGVFIVLLTSYVVSKITLRGKQKVAIFIISPQSEAIRETLLHDMDNGVTLLQIETGKERSIQKGILCVTENRKLHSINEIVNNYDNHAFTIISQVNEVRGRGFSIAR